jgi:hypothetical protein
LQTRILPKRILGRVRIHPRRGAGPGLRLRMVFEVELLRYMLSLAPIAAAALIFPDKALAISQAPLLMFGLVYLVETRVLRVPKDKRAALLPLADQERGLDLLRQRGRSLLTKIAAGRGLADGRLVLVVEQSDLAGVAPLSLVSVQRDPGAEVLALTAPEEALLRDGLFQPPLDERALHKITLAGNEGVHAVELEMRAVSAHARLAAMMD